MGFPPPPPPQGLKVGDRVRSLFGVWAGMEGEAKEILETAGMVRVELTIFGQRVPVEHDSNDIESV